jgi:hypothetical protein
MPCSSIKMRPIPKKALDDVVVNERRKFQCEVRTDISHTVMTRGQHEEVLTIPVFIKGVTSCITMRKPTQD